MSTWKWFTKSFYNGKCLCYNVKLLTVCIENTMQETMPKCSPLLLDGYSFFYFILFLCFFLINMSAFVIWKKYTHSNLFSNLD